MLPDLKVPTMVVLPAPTPGSIAEAEMILAVKLKSERVALPFGKTPLDYVATHLGLATRGEALRAISNAQRRVSGERVL